MTLHEQEIIKQAIELNGQGGVRTFIDIDGTFASNYVPYRKYFKDVLWTKEHQEYAISVWKEFYAGRTE